MKTFASRFGIFALASLSLFVFGCYENNPVYYRPASNADLAGSWHWKSTVEFADPAAGCPVKAGDSTLATLTFAAGRYYNEYLISGFDSSNVLRGDYEAHYNAADTGQFYLGDLFFSGAYVQSAGKTVVDDEFRVVNDSLIIGVDNWTWAGATAQCVGKSAVVVSKF